MRILAVGQHAVGVIAIGQEATGFFAIGQFATGVIAIGQVARGFIAIGQLALGFFALGQLALGLSFCVAMLGAGGRSLGGVIPLVPVPPRRKAVPKLSTPAETRSGRAWWRGTLTNRPGTVKFALKTGGQTVPVAVRADLFFAALHFARNPSIELFAEVERRGEGYRLVTLQRAAEDASGKPWFGALSVVQLVLLVVGAAVFVNFCVLDLGDALVAMIRDARINGITFM